VDEFVICPACGARIKAGREFCLRCFGPLPTPERPIKPPIWVSLGLSDQNKILVAVGIAAVIAALVGVIVWTEPPAVDDTSQPAPNVPRAAAPAAPAPNNEGGTAAPVDPKLQAQRELLEAALEKTPNDGDALNNLGLVLQQMGQQDEAFQRLTSAVSAQPRKAAFRMNLGQLASDLGRWDTAIDQYREVVRLQPRDYLSEYALAVALQNKGDHASAVQEFEKARRLGPSAPAVPLGLATSYEKLGRTTDAAREYQEYLRLQPTGADADRVRARLTALGGRL